MALGACAPGHDALIATALQAPAGAEVFNAEDPVPLALLPHARRPSVVAFSGGGPDGAFGAGYITARLRSGHFAQPDVMTGVSIGALVAVLAFVGAEDRLEAVFAQGGLEGMAGSTDPLRGLLGSSFSGSERYAAVIAAALADAVLAKVAIEQARGRRLYVATTDLDGMTTAVWDLGAIAASGTPGAYDFLRQVVLASGSIPGVFPPVALADGAGAKRLYVDGGASAQFYVPDLPKGRALSNVLIVINNALDADPPLSRYSALATAQRGFSTIIRAQSRDLIEIERLKRMRDGGHLTVVALPEDAPASKLQDFSAKAMAETFALGMRIGAGA